MEWFKESLIKEGAIEKEDLKLFKIVDDYQDVFRTIKEFYSSRKVSKKAKKRE